MNKEQKEQIALSVIGARVISDGTKELLLKSAYSNLSISKIIAATPDNEKEIVFDLYTNIQMALFNNLIADAGN